MGISKKMSGTNKDSSEVIEFSILFEKLKSWSDDDDKDIIKFANEDESIKKLCQQVMSAAQKLKNAENNSQKFAEGVDPTFIAIWRDFEMRWEKN